MLITGYLRAEAKFSSLGAPPPASIAAGSGRDAGGAGRVSRISDGRAAISTRPKRSSPLVWATDSLIEAIKEDIRVAQAFLARHDQRAHRAHKALRAPPRVPTGLVVAGALAAGAGAVWLFSKRKE